MIENFSAEHPEKYIEALDFIDNLKLADWPGGPVDAKDGRVHIGLINSALLPRGTANMDLASYRTDAVRDLRYGDPAKARALIDALADGLEDEWPEADSEAVDNFRATVRHIQDVLGR